MNATIFSGLSTAQVAAQLDSQVLEKRDETILPYGHDREDQNPSVPSPECPECPWGN